MALSEICGACGCDLTDAALQPSGAVRHGSLVYCGECARLILSPEELSPSAKTQPNTTIPPKPPARKATIASLDDDWLSIPKSEKPGEATVEMPPDKLRSAKKKQGESKSPEPEDEAVEVEAEESGTDEEEEQDAEADGEEAEAPRKLLKRLGPKKAGTKPPAKDSQVRPGVNPPARDSQTRPGVKPAAKDSQTRPKVQSASRLPAKPEPTPVPARTSEKRSGRISGRTAARAAAKEKDVVAERESLRKNTRAPSSMSTTTMIGIGVGLFVILAVMVVYGTSSPTPPEKKVVKQSAFDEDNDKTPSDDYVKHAREEQSAGNIVEAAALYVKAANAAEREGRPTAAQKYATLAYDLKKNLHLDLSGRH